MSEASVVASTLDSTLQRAARTRESYEQEIAALSAELMSLRTAVDFLQTAIASHGAYEREEAERIAADKRAEKERREQEERDAKETAERIAAEWEAEQRAAEEALRETEKQLAIRDEKERERAEKLKEKKDMEERQKEIEYKFSDQARFDESLALLNSLKASKKKQK